jgi:hypothetical protein
LQVQSTRSRARLRSAALGRIAFSRQSNVSGWRFDRRGAKAHAVLAVGHLWLDVNPSLRQYLLPRS